jgi:predicted O-methyltransferase YrrM
MNPASLVGLISRVEGERLADLAAAVPPEQAIVELGSYKGKSTVYLASSGHHVYAVDRWTLGGQRSPLMARWRYDAPATFAAFNEQVARAAVVDLVSPIVGDTVEVARSWTEPVGLLFVDADHAEASVRADLEAWEPHCVGVIAFDDYGPRWPGVVKVVDELIERRGAARELTDGLMAVWLSGERIHAAV